jgi:hypothetical protein
MWQKIIQTGNIPMWTLIDLIPKPILYVLIIGLAAMSVAFKVKEVELTLELEKEKTHVAQFTTDIAQTNADAATKAAQFEKKAREAESNRAAREKELLAHVDNANAALKRLRDYIGTHPVPEVAGCEASTTDATLARDDLLTVSSRLVEVSKICDRHVNDIKTLIQFGGG